MLLEIKKLKRFSHVLGEEVEEQYNLESSTDRYFAHKMIDSVIERFECKSGLEESINDLYNLHEVITEQKQIDDIIDLGEWSLFVNTL